MIDLAGQVFGRLTVVAPTEERQSESVVWVCHCSCGKECCISARSLRQGGTKSCGCLRKESISARTRGHLENRQFGRLTVIALTNKRDRYRHTIWLCRCSCGKECEISATNLLTGNTLSCGCLALEIWHDRQGPRNPAWQGGFTGPYSFEFNEELKESIRDRDQHLCRICGMTEEENGCALSIHHVDYDKNNLSPHNLISLCAKCHPKTGPKTRRSYWKAYFTRLLQESPVEVI